MNNIKNTLHKKIYSKIKLDIENGIHKVGDKLPSIREMMVLFNVSNTTALKVLGELEKNGYITKLHGSGIFVNDITNIPRKIALILPYLYGDIKWNARSQDIFPPMVNGIELGMREYYGQISLYTSFNRPNLERDNIRLILQSKPDGIIAIKPLFSENMPEIKSLIKSKIPIVFLENIPDNLSATCIATDNYNVFKYFAQKANLEKTSDVIYISNKSSERICETTKARIKGFFENINNPKHIKKVLMGDNSDENQRFELEGILSIMSKRVIIIGIHGAFVRYFIEALKDSKEFTSRDFLLMYIDEIGCELPENVSAISAIQPLYEIGQTAISEIMRMIDTGSSDVKDIALPVNYMYYGKMFN